MTPQAPPVAVFVRDLEPPTSPVEGVAIEWRLYRCEPGFAAGAHAHVIVETVRNRGRAASFVFAADRDGAPLERAVPVGIRRGLDHRAALRSWGYEIRVELGPLCEACGVRAGACVGLRETACGVACAHCCDHAGVGARRCFALDTPPGAAILRQHLLECLGARA